LELAVKNENDTLQEQLAQKTTPNESPLTALAPGGGSGGRRITKDPDSFSGTEKTITKSPPITPRILRRARDSPRNFPGFSDPRKSDDPATWGVLHRDRAHAPPKPHPSLLCCLESGAKPACTFGASTLWQSLSQLASKHYRNFKLVIPTLEEYPNYCENSWSAGVLRRRFSPAPQKMNAHSRMCIHSKSVWLTMSECTLTSAPPENGKRKKAAYLALTRTHNQTKLRGTITLLNHSINRHLVQRVATDWLFNYYSATLPV
jgi:hypothetical protein